METPHEDNVVVEDLAIMNMSSPEQVKNLVGATKYLHWVREKEAPVQKLVMQEEVSIHEEAPVQKEHGSDMIPVTRITCLVMMRAMERMRR